MATPNSEAIAILQQMEKATDDAGFVSRVEKRINDAFVKSGLFVGDSGMAGNAEAATMGHSGSDLNRLALGQRQRCASADASNR